MNTPPYRRWAAVAFGLVFCGVGVLIVSHYRSLGTRFGVGVPWWWFLIAGGQPLLSTLIAICIPTSNTLWRGGRLSTPLCWLALGTAIYLPTIYTIYGFERLMDGGTR